MNKLNICIIHYNTPDMTECLIKSINKFVPNAKIILFDNSDANPFTYRQKNLVYIDNTQHQYIDFDYELENNYTTLVSGTAYLNHYISFKHCISVQKCMSIIKEDFILLDSDVLLKKDISEIVDKDCIFVGSTEHKEGAAERAIPFMLYINTPLCKQYGIKFFNKNYMHGITSKEGNKYDTGAYFLKRAKDYNYKIINIEDYIVHYKAGSWLENAKKYIKYEQIPQEMWLQNNRKYWQNEKTNNKVVIYTAIVGDYDKLLLHTYVNNKFDYVCFTDNPNAESGLYKILPIPEEIKHLPLIKQQRYLKINAHKYLSQYDISVWLDGNVELLGNPLKIIDKTNYLYIPQHPIRKCIYEEGLACISAHKDTSTNINKQLDRYKEEHYPEDNGLVQSNIIIRRHNNKNCIKLMEDWWAELENGSHRDQLSFNYALWKNPSVKIVLLDKMIYRSEYFYWNKGHGDNIQISKKDKTKIKDLINTSHHRELVPIIRINKKAQSEISKPKQEIKQTNQTKTIQIRNLSSSTPIKRTIY